MLKAALNRLAKDSLIYGVGNGLTKFIQILTLPVASRALSIKEFGDWNLLTLSAGVFSAFMVFGMENAVIRFMYDSNSESHHKKLFTTGISFIILISLFLVSVFWQMDTMILEIINLDMTYSSAFKVTVVWLPAIALQTFLLNWFKWTLQKWKFIIISFGFVALNLSSLIIAAKLNLLDVNVLLLSSCASQWASIVLGLIMCKDQFSFQLDLTLLKKMILYGAPFMLVMLIGALRNSIDRFILSDFSKGDVQLVGLYSMGQRLGIIMNFFVYTLDIVLGPLILSSWNLPDAKLTFASLQKYYLLFLNWIAICICSFAPMIVRLLATDDYVSVVGYLPIFILSNCFLGLYVFASIGIIYSKKSYLNAISLALSLISLYAFAYVLTPLYLEWGVAVAYFMSVLVMVISGYLFSKRFYSIPYNWDKDLLIMLMGIILSFFAVNLQIVDDKILNCFMVLFVVNVLYAIFTLLVFSSNEKNAINHFFRKNILK